MLSIENEYLFWVPATETRVGVMPGFYERATTEADRRVLINMGGVDVSADPKAWLDYNRGFHDASLSSA